MKQAQQQNGKILTAIAICLAMYALAGLFAVSVAGETEGITIPLALGIFVATVQVSAMWAVFGSGSYLRRILVATVCVLIVVAGISLGFFAMGVNIVTREFFDNTMFILLGIWQMLVAAQLPFWLFRGICGWQFVREGERPSQSFSIRDLMFLTVVCALALAAPRMMAALSGVAIVGNAPDVSQEKLFVDSSIRSSLLTAGFSLFIGLPVVLMVFRSKTIEAGCTLIALFMFVLFIILSVLIAGVGGTPPPELVAFLFGALFCFGVATWIPLSTLKSHGFRLTSPARFRNEASTGSNSGLETKIVDGGVVNSPFDFDEDEPA